MRHVYPDIGLSQMFVATGLCILKSLIKQLPQSPIQRLPQSFIKWPDL